MPKITFNDLNKTIEVDPSQIPFGDHGLPGSILDIAIEHGVEIEHACGGNAACSTCHVIVATGPAGLSEMQDEEADRLDTAKGLTLQSRLACQAVVTGDVSILIPGT